MSLCQFYYHKKSKSKSNVITGNRCQAKPTIHDIKKCSHPDSVHKPGTISGNVPCEGNASLCIITNA
jgi:hypothetical protein